MRRCRVWEPLEPRPSALANVRGHTGEDHFRGECREAIWMTTAWTTPSNALRSPHSPRPPTDRRSATTGAAVSVPNRRSMASAWFAYSGIPPARRRRADVTDGMSPRPRRTWRNSGCSGRRDHKTSFRDATAPTHWATEGAGPAGSPGPAGGVLTTRTQTGPAPR